MKRDAIPEEKQIVIDVSPEYFPETEFFDYNECALLSDLGYCHAIKNLPDHNCNEKNCPLLQGKTILIKFKKKSLTEEK